MISYILHKLNLNNKITLNQILIVNILIYILYICFDTLN